MRPQAEGEICSGDKTTNFSALFCPWKFTNALTSENLNDHKHDHDHDHKPNHEYDHDHNCKHCQTQNDKNGKTVEIFENKHDTWLCAYLLH